MVDLSACGNFSCILRIEAEFSTFREYCNYIFKEFHADEVFSSKFNVNTFAIHDFDYNGPIEADDFVKKIILVKTNESIIIEYFRSVMLVQDMVTGNDYMDLKGTDILSYINNRHSDAIMILGFELSIFSNSFEDSLQDTIADDALHPISVVTKEVGVNNVSEYSTNADHLTNLKLEIYRSYLMRVL